MSNTVASAALPASTGGLFIPAIDRAVPVHFSRGLGRTRSLARFAQAAERAGVPLPSGDFVTIEQVVSAQWEQFLVSKYPLGTFEGLAGSPAIGVSDDTLEVVINSESNLNAFQLKPIVEELEAAALGLGWYVESVLSKATSHGHHIYDMGMVTYMLDVFHGSMDEYSDQGYAHSLLLEEGERDVPALGQIPQETIDRLKEQYNYWPSDLLTDVGGHKHLLRQGQAPGEKVPKVMSDRQAAKWLKANRGHKLAGAVETAIHLRKALKNDPSRDFVWFGNNDVEDESESMGAMCFLCWEDPQLLFDAVSHFEESQYNGGMAVEAFARRVVYLAEAGDEDLQDVAITTVDYFNRWALLAKLLSYFPIWEDDDET
jgi:PRTRC genetic system protein F